MDIVLNSEEMRVLGALMEKEITTPDYYPMTLNALRNACNQRSCREPVIAYDESTIVRALDSLREKNLVALFSGAGSHTLKYKQRLTENFFFPPEERAILCELLLRGAQTPGELRTRAERMHPFQALSEVEAALDELRVRPDGPWVMQLPRQPGRKEARYMHLLGGEDFAAVAADAESPTVESRGERKSSELDALREEVRQLRGELGDLREQFAAFRRQFE